MNAEYPSFYNKEITIMILKRCDHLMCQVPILVHKYTKIHPYASMKGRHSAKISHC